MVKTERETDVSEALLFFFSLRSLIMSRRWAWLIIANVCTGAITRAKNVIRKKFQPA